MRQPDKGLEFHNAAYPFLMIEVACSESEVHLISKAKEYIRYSRRRISYVIILSVTALAIDASLSSQSEFHPNDSPTQDEFPPLSPLTSLGCAPTSPIEINKRFGSMTSGDSDQTSSMMSSAPLMRDKASKRWCK